MRRGSGAWYISYAMFGFLVPGLASILLPLLVVDAGHRPFRVGSVVAAQNWGILLAPAWGYYADRFRTYRSTLVIGLFCLGSGFGAFGIVRSLTALFGASFLIGIGTGACSTVASLLVVESNPIGAWSRGIGRLQLCGAAGTVLGFMVAGRMPANEAAIFGSILVIPAVLLGVWHLPSPPLSNRQHAARGQTDTRIDSGTDLLNRSGKPILFILFLVIWSLFSLAISAFAALFPITMFRAFGLHVRVSVDTIAVATMISLPLYSLAGGLVTRYGAVRLFSVGIFVRFLSLSALALLSVFHSSRTLPVLFLIALFQGIWPLLGVSSGELAALLAPGLEGTAIGLFNATGAFSSGIGAMLSGLVADLSGYRSISIWAAGVSFGAFLVSLILVRRVTARIAANQARRAHQADHDPEPPTPCDHTRDRTTGSAAEHSLGRPGERRRSVS